MQGAEESKGMIETLDLEGKYFCLEHTGASACPALAKERNARIDTDSLITNEVGEWLVSVLAEQQHFVNHRSVTICICTSLHAVV